MVVSLSSMVGGQMSSMEPDSRKLHHILDFGSRVVVAWVYQD